MQTNNRTGSHRTPDNPRGSANNPLWLSPILITPAPYTNISIEHHSPTHTPTSNDDNSTERSLGINRPRRSRKKRSLSRSAPCPYNLRSKRRRIPPNGQSPAMGPSGETVIIDSELVEVRNAVEWHINDELILNTSTLNREARTGQICTSIAADSAAGTKTAQAKPAREVTPSAEPDFVFEFYQPMLHWRYDTNDTRCVICMEDLEKFCSECQKVQHDRFPYDPDCKLIWGKCSHVFHNHCLQEWFKKGNTGIQTCPLDRQMFEVDYIS